MNKTIPTGDEKIGKKINYLIQSTVFPKFKAHGFKKRARVIYRNVNTDCGEVTQVISFQGNKWNEGAEGSFCINIGIFFPTISRLLSSISLFQDEGTCLEKVDEACCQIRERIPHVIPSEREKWWPDELEANKDVWFKIDKKTDITILGEAISRVITEYLYPWFDKHSFYSNLLTFNEDTLLPIGPMPKVAATIVLGKEEEGNNILQDFLSDTRLDSQIIEEIIQWAITNGISAR